MKRAPSLMIVVAIVGVFLVSGLAPSPAAAQALGQGQGLGLGVVQGLGQGTGVGQGGGQGQGQWGKVFLDPVLPLAEQPTLDLQFLRAEEKLQRDVYLALYAKWHLYVFYTISLAEQSHTDLLERMIDAYQVTDPIPDDSVVGFPTLPAFQTLYNEKVTDGSQSVEAGLRVGIALEAQSIADLEARIGNAGAYPDIQAVYQHLLECSQNHKAAFEKCLAALLDGGNGA